jgi:hypothetical protein
MPKKGLTETQIRLLKSKIVLPKCDKCDDCGYVDVGETDNRIDTVYKHYNFEMIVKMFMKGNERPEKMDDKFVNEFLAFYDTKAEHVGQCYYCNLGVWSDEEEDLKK